MTKSNKLSTYEFTDNVILMTLVSGEHADKNKSLARIMNSVKDETGHKNSDPGDPIYDVKVTVNGIALDWRDFSAHVNETFDKWVAEAAGDIVKSNLNPELNDMHYAYEQALERLKMGIEREAARLLGVKLDEEY